MQITILWEGFKEREEGGQRKLAPPKLSLLSSSSTNSPKRGMEAGEGDIGQARLRLNESIIHLWVLCPESLWAFLRVIPRIHFTQKPDLYKYFCKVFPLESISPESHTPPPQPQLSEIYLWPTVMCLKDLFDFCMASDRKQTYQHKLSVAPGLTSLPSRYWMSGGQLSQGILHTFIAAWGKGCLRFLSWCCVLSELIYEQCIVRQTDR